MSAPKVVEAEGLWLNLRFMHASMCIMGSVVQLKHRDNSLYEGVLQSFNPGFVICLEKAIKLDAEKIASKEQQFGANIGNLHNALKDGANLEERLFFKLGDIVRLSVLDIDLSYATRDTSQNVVTDTEISGYDESKSGEHRELQSWEDDRDDQGNGCVLAPLEGDLKASNSQNGGWDAQDMFKYNKVHFKVESTYDENLATYTVPLAQSDSKEWREKAEKAEAVAREINSNPKSQNRLAKEDGDEEELFSAVVRPVKTMPHRSPNQVPNTRPRVPHNINRFDQTRRQRFTNTTAQLRHFSKNMNIIPGPSAPAGLSKPPVNVTPKVPLLVGGATNKDATDSALSQSSSVPAPAPTSTSTPTPGHQHTANATPMQSQQQHQHQHPQPHQQHQHPQQQQQQQHQPHPHQQHPQQHQHQNQQHQQHQHQQHQHQQHQHQQHQHQQHQHQQHQHQQHQHQQQHQPQQHQHQQPQHQHQQPQHQHQQPPQHQQAQMQPHQLQHQPQSQSQQAATQASAPRMASGPGPSVPAPVSSSSHQAPPQGVRMSHQAGPAKTNASQTSPAVSTTHQASPTATDPQLELARKSKLNPHAKEYKPQTTIVPPPMPQQHMVYIQRSPHPFAQQIPQTHHYPQMMHQPHYPQIAPHMYQPQLMPPPAHYAQPIPQPHHFSTQMPQPYAQQPNSLWVLPVNAWYGDT